MDTQPQATSPAPAAPVHTTPRDFFLWLGAIVALYSSVVSAIVLLFDYLNRVYPDPLDYLYGSGSVDGPAQAAMATLAIAAPLTVILFRTIRRTVAQEPARTELWVRRWAIVATLFIAGAVLAIDLVTVLNGFLRGELTIRFALKALIILLIAGGVFLHFLADLRGYWRSQPRYATFVGIGFIVAAYAVTAAGFMIIGTPGQLRAWRLDEKRMDDLDTAMIIVQAYVNEEKKLPVSLAEAVEQNRWQTVPVDPETRAPYEYRTLGPWTYELCATFTAPMRQTGTDLPHHLQKEFAHDSGRTCFELTADEPMESTVQ